MSLDCSRILEEADLVLSVLSRSKGLRVVEIHELTDVLRDVVQGLLYLLEREGFCHHQVRGGGWLWFLGERTEEGVETRPKPDLTERQQMILEVLSRESPVKVFPKELLGVLRKISGMENEFSMSVAQTLRTLRSKNLVKGEDTPEGTIYWVEGDRSPWDVGVSALLSSYPRGVSLSHLLEECRSKVEPIPPNQYFLMEILSEVGVKREGKWYPKS